MRTSIEFEALTSKMLLKFYPSILSQLLKQTSPTSDSCYNPLAIKTPLIWQNLKLKWPYNIAIALFAIVMSGAALWLGSILEMLGVINF